MSCNLFEKFKKPLSKILFYSIVLVALVFGVLYLMENKQKEAPAGVAPSYVVPQRNIESNIQNYDLRKDIDPIFNKVHDELSVAYYNKKPFRNYGILTKEQFDNLHALIFLIRDVKFKEENLKLPTQNQIPEKDYNDILDDKGKVVGKKSEEAAKKIQELNAEGYNLTIPFIDNSFSYGNYGLRKNGSSEDIYQRFIPIASSAFVETDASQLIEGEIAGTATDFYLTGYTTAAASCGDGTCNGSETHATCPADCPLTSNTPGSTIINTPKTLAGPQGGLVGNWSFNGQDTNWTSATVGTTNDLSGNNNTGTMTNMNRSSSPSIGISGQALNFDGVDDYVSLPYNKPLPDDYNATSTISAWFKTNSTGVIVSIQNAFPPATPSSYDPLLYIQSTGILHAGGYIGGFPNLVSSSALNDNKWHHAVLTIQGSGASQTQSLYIDGVFVNSISGGMSGATNYWEIGTGYTMSWPNTNNSWYYFNGLIDEVRVYSRVLSASEITDLYRLGTRKFQPTQ